MISELFIYENEAYNNCDILYIELIIKENTWE